MALWMAGCAVLGAAPPGSGEVGIGDLLLFVALPFGGLALMWLPGAPRDLFGRGRTVVDGLIVAAALVLTAWVAGLDELSSGLSESWLAFAGLHTVGAIALAGMAVVLLTRAAPDARRVFGLLSAGLTLLALADALVTIVRLDGALNGPGPLVALWVAGLAGLAAASAGPFGSRPGLPTRASVSVPSVPLALSLVMLAAETARGELSSFLVWNAALVAVLVIARQVLSLLESIAYWATLEDEIKARTEEVGSSQRRFRSLVQNSSEVVTVLAPSGEVRYQSPSIARVFEHSPERLEKEGPGVLIELEDLDRLRSALAELEPGATRSVRCRVRRADGRPRRAEITACNLVEDPDVRGHVLNIRDETERVELEDQLKHRAFHDPLTDLANRALFRDRVDHALARSVRHYSEVAVLFVDVDDFKRVNDIQGHGAGDELLVAAGERLQRSARSGDTVGRLGGDEFGVLVEDVEDERAPMILAERILEALREPFELSGGVHYTSASVGIATTPGAGLEGDVLVRNADIAMYAAKSCGKGTYEVFDDDMHARVARRAELERDLRLALAREQLHLAYQPIVSLATGRICAVEALARWDHPVKGPIGPDEFIPVAEESGLILSLGRWVLATAARQVRDWRAEFGDDEEGALGLAVNFSPHQLRQELVADEVVEILDRSGLDPAALTVEITEGLLMEDTDRTIARLRTLRERGMRIAIDDFGTGFSSLRYLVRFPADTLKIDRSFVARIEADSHDLALVQAVVALAHALGLKTVAEGVETEHQLAELAATGCDCGQGFLFDRPVPPSVVAQRLAQQSPSGVRAVPSPI